MAARSLEARIPIIRLYENLLVVLQGAVDDRMIAQLKEEIPLALDRYDAEGVVISVSGVDVMDTYISRMIHDVAVVCRLMGVDTVVCGISGLVAQTLVSMGMDMGDVSTHRNVERALEALAERRRARLRVEGEDEDEDEGEEVLDEDRDEGDEAGARRPKAARRSSKKGES